MPSGEQAPPVGVWAPPTGGWAPPPTDLVAQAIQPVECGRRRPREPGTSGHPEEPATRDLSIVGVIIPMCVRCDWGTRMCISGVPGGDVGVWCGILRLFRDMSRELLHNAMWPQPHCLFRKVWDFATVSRQTSTLGRLPVAKRFMKNRTRHEQHRASKGSIGWSFGELFRHV